VTPHSELSMPMDWGDMDLFGHINNVAIMRYIQTARVHFWDQYDIPSLPGKNPGPVLASANFKFLHSLVYPGNIHIKTWLKSMGNTSFTLHHEIYDQNGRLSAEAQDVIVMLDYEVRKKAPIPDEVRESFGRLLEN